MRPSADPRIDALRWLGLCPLLAGATGTREALGLGLATLVALLASGAIARALRDRLPDEVRWPALLALVAAVVGAIVLALLAWLPALHAQAVAYSPLIVVACLSALFAPPVPRELATTGMPALVAPPGTREPATTGMPALVAPPITRELATTGLGYLLVLLAIGALREWLGDAVPGLALAAALLLLGLLAALRAKMRA